MEKWKEDYNRYMHKHLEEITKGLDNPTILHHCFSCGAYLWADEKHESYRHCIYCGVNLKGKKLPFERI